MKKTIVLLIALCLVLTSCVTAIKTKEVMEDVKAPVTEEKEETPETPDVPDVPKEPTVPVTPETTVDPEEVTEVTEEPEEPKTPELTTDKGTPTNSIITPDNNETSAIEFYFNDVTEDELQDLFDAITNGETIEFPVIPME